MNLFADHLKIPQLRDYQTDAVESIYNAWKQHRRVLLQLFTGLGKSVIASKIIDDEIKAGGRPIFIVDRIALVDQTVEHLEQWGLTVGVIQADHYKANPYADVQVCSIQTLARRRDIPFTLGIIDETHILHKHHIKLLETYNNIRFLGLSATPWAAGLGLYYDTLIKGPDIQWAIKNKFLVPSVVFAPTEFDKRLLSKVAGDYSANSIEKHFGTKQIIGDIVNHWMQHGEDRQTLCFAATVKHSRNIVAEFNSKGIEAHHIDANTQTHERTFVINKFKQNKIRVLSSVGVLTTGFDAPNASCGIFARQTKSLMLHYQMWGRLIRPSLDKKDALIFDHAGNTLELGDNTMPTPDYLSTDKRVSVSVARPNFIKKTKKCSACGYLYFRGRECPACHFVPVVKSDVKVIDADLVRVKKEPAKGPDAKIASDTDIKIKWYSMLRGFAANKGYKPGYAWFKFKDKFGHQPTSDIINRSSPIAPNEEVNNWLKHKRIKYAKSMQAAAKRSM